MVDESLHKPINFVNQIQVVFGMAFSSVIRRKSPSSMGRLIMLPKTTVFGRRILVP
ncbi:hypothetical protein ACFL2Q_03950 [Thermodesulfobacteriota bacterium]